MCGARGLFLGSCAISWLWGHLPAHPEQLRGCLSSLQEGCAVPGWSLSPPHIPRGLSGDGLWCQGLNPAWLWCPNHPGPDRALPAPLGTEPWMWGQGVAVGVWWLCHPPGAALGSLCTGLGAPALLGVARIGEQGLLAGVFVSPQGPSRGSQLSLGSPWLHPVIVSAFSSPSGFLLCRIPPPQQHLGGCSGAWGPEPPTWSVPVPTGKSPRAPGAFQEHSRSIPGVLVLLLQVPAASPGSAPSQGCSAHHWGGSGVWAGTWHR